MLAARFFRNADALILLYSLPLFTGFVAAGVGVSALKTVGNATVELR